MARPGNRRQVRKACNARWYEKNKKRVQASNRKWRDDNPAYFLWLNAKKRHKQDFSITSEQVIELCAPMTCSVTGLPLLWKWDGTGKNPWAPSIDRIDNSRGYTPDNIRVVCWIFNLSKSTWDDAVVERFRSGR